MRLEWLEDILAVMETGSLTRAAKKRLLTQPAFSRRIKQIENFIGAELLDRTKKPARLKRSVIDQQQNIQELVANLHELRQELKHHNAETQNRITIGSQHAIATSIAPTLVRKLSNNHDIDIRLRSANRDECYALLITKQVDFILIHQSQNEHMSLQEGVFDQCNLGREGFIPVYSTAEMKTFDHQLANGEISVIAYPADVFLGSIANKEIFSKMWGTMSIHKKAVTALTLATLHLTLAGVGVAWLPYSVAAPELINGRLTDLSGLLPFCELNFVAVRLNEPKSPEQEAVWDIVSSTMNLPLNV